MYIKQITFLRRPCALIEKKKNITLKVVYSKYKSLYDMSDIVNKPPARSNQSTIPDRKEIRHLATEFEQDMGPAQPSIQWERAALKPGGAVVCI